MGLLGRKATIAMFVLFPMAFSVPNVPLAAPAEPIGSALAIPFAGPCVDCEPCGGYAGHVAPNGSEGNWNTGHGTHAFCWEEQTCDDRHDGPCGVLPAASLNELLEQARLAAIEDTPDEFLRLTQESSTYITFNDKRRAIQVKTCDGSERIIANFPVRWGD